MIAELIGGIGFFLVGMMLTTEGLRAAAGETLRLTLLRFTGGPLKALLSGALVTALVQSSSVTIVATIGFVGAGLLTFQQSLGLIFGANIGTTATGWLVSMIGLKVSVTSFALPVVGVGAIIKMLGRGRSADAGLALAGFGMIFVGVGVLQEGMQGLSQHLHPEQLPGDTLGGRLVLLLIGAVLTSVMQSSSAAVATTLTALDAGSISLAQAAAMVIGANIGTTVTAGIAAVGASTSAKRTALAHFLFNVLTGLIAFASLPLFVTLASSLAQRLRPGDAAVAIAAFHTTFNVFGVAIILPLTTPLANFVIRTVPERGAHLTRHLDVNATHLGSLAIEAVRQTAVELAHELFSTLQSILTERAISRESRVRLDAVDSAHEETVRFMSELSGSEHTTREMRHRHASTLHALDHLERLTDTLLRLDDSVFLDRPEIAELRRLMTGNLQTLLEWTGDPTQAAPTASARVTSEQLAEHRKRIRSESLKRTAKGELKAAEAGKMIEAARRLDEMAYYLWRIAEHLSGERILAS